MSEETDENIRHCVARVVLKAQIPPSCQNNAGNLKVLIFDIKRTLKNYTISDIDYAIDLVLEGALKYKLTTYDATLGIKFFADLMGVYRVFRANQKEWKKLINLDVPKPLSEDKSEELEFKNLRRYTIETYQKALDGTITDRDVVSSDYIFLVDKCKVFSPSKERKIKTLEKALTSMNLDAGREVSSYQLAKGDFSAKSRYNKKDPIVINKAKSILALQYYKEMAKDEFDLGEMLPSWEEYKESKD